MTSTTTMTAARDGTPILVRHWAPARAAWATVVLVHGVAEHSGRYERVGDWLTAAGLDVVSYDQRGFGASGGRRAYVDRWAQVHDDLAERLVAARAAARERPIVLWGHSLGGLIALGYCVADPARPLPDALVLSAPALDAAIAPWKRSLAPVLAAVAPRLEIANGFEPGILAADPAVDEAYLADPLVLTRTTTRFGLASFREQARVRSLLGRLAVPTYVYHGEDDRLVPTASSEPLGRLPTVTRRTWPGLRHETHNEANGREVIGAAVEWLRSVLGSADN
ncbi:MAG TPA: alpha/beta hydrolase [Candidatus Limnocylindrales bacterium]|nr:alpha/beta hydrolase [Candidatus Limnocylindrales bacterium]